MTHAPTPSRVPLPPLDEMTAVQRQIYDQTVAYLHGPVGPRMALLLTPEIAQKWSELASAIDAAALPRRLRELAILIVAREWDSQFEWWAHARLAREAGVSAAVIEALRNDQTPAFPNGDEAAVYDYTTELLRRHDVSDVHYERLRAVLGEKTLVEMTVLVGHYVNTAMTPAAHRMALPRGGAPRTATPDIRMDRAVRAANEAVYQHSRRSIQLHGMGTTLVGLLLEVDRANPDRRSLTLVHVGDSRCYLYREGMLNQLTHDHSLVEEHVRAGEMTPEEAATHPMRNIITRAVGSQPEVEPETANLEPQAGDLYLLASDGLTRELTDTDIAQILFRAQSRANDGRLNLESVCETLVDEANDAGGGDNITVLLVQLP